MLCFCDGHTCLNRQLEPHSLLICDHGIDHAYFDRAVLKAISSAPRKADMPLKISYYTIFILLLLGLGELQSKSFAIDLNDLSDLDVLSVECINTRRSNPCRRALALSETMQRNAASQRNYGCQTRLLGLGADLILMSFDEGRRGAALATLEQVKTFCDASHGRGL